MYCAALRRRKIERELGALNPEIAAAGRSQDWARLAGLKIIFPPRVFPVNSVKAMRGCILVEPDGTPVGAVVGFCNMLMRIIDEAGGDLIGIVFDAPGDNFRHTLFDRYKANRSAPPEDLVPQFSIVREAVEAFGHDLQAYRGAGADRRIGHEEIDPGRALDPGRDRLAQLVQPGGSRILAGLGYAVDEGLPDEGRGGLGGVADREVVQRATVSRELAPRVRRSQAARDPATLPAVATGRLVFEPDGPEGPMALHHLLGVLPVMGQVQLGESVGGALGRGLLQHQLYAGGLAQLVADDVHVGDDLASELDSLVRLI